MFSFKHVVKLFCLLLIPFIWACGRSDGPEPPRDPTVQVVEDHTTLMRYLETHFYNYEEFNSSPSDANIRVTIDTIMGDNVNKTPLSNQVQSRTIDYRHSTGQTVTYNYYYLTLREGTGDSPSIVDSTYVSYSGELLNRTQFDNRTAPIWLDLTNVVRGFSEGVSQLKTGRYYVNPDNTVNFYGYGQGLFIFPSGLGYYSRPSGGVPAYAPLVFEVNLYTLKETDHDGDGTLSKDEYDTDNDGIPDDSDGDGTPDYLDAT